MEKETQPLVGRRVAIVHPAWHSCGTYSVVLGQIAAYQALGATVMTLAFSDVPGFTHSRGWIWRDYVAHTPELSRQERHCVGLPLHRVFDPAFLASSVWPFAHGDQAAMRAGAAAATTFSPSLLKTHIDIVHCNHFFCMPIARRLTRGRPILLDTHDLQAQQFDLINDARFILPPRVSREKMLARELTEMRDAAALLHLNADEEETFRGLLPDAAHHLLFPPVPDVPTGPGGDDIILVSSWNAANLESMLWFLREVLPRAGNPAVRIVGNIDAGVRSADRALYEQHRHLFLGRVDDLDAVYAHAKTALLPTIAGTGLSIKTVEAMASGLPLIASPLAFRGVAFDRTALRNVTVATDAVSFATALRDAATEGAGSSRAARAASDTRRAYETTFSEKAYAARLLEILTPLLAIRAT